MNTTNKLTQNEIEMYVEQVLIALQKRDKYIRLQLHPASGESGIREYGNVIFINEGRDGRFEDISDAFYMQMVYKYDTLCKRK